MENLNNWCESLIISVILVLLIELLVENNKNKKYIQVITGIFIMFVTLNPFIELLNNNDFDTDFFKFEKVSAKPYEENELFENVYIDYTLERIKNVLDSYNLKVLDLDFKLDESKENLEKIEVIIKKDMAKESEDFVSEEKVKNLIKEELDITEDVLVITYE